MTGSKHNREGESGDKGEPSPGPYFLRMHRHWWFWVCAALLGAAIAIYEFTGDLAWVPHARP
jgi:hypothetical protein